MQGCGFTSGVDEGAMTRVSMISLFVEGGHSTQGVYRLTMMLLSQIRELCLHVILGGVGRLETKIKNKLNYKLINMVT